MQPRFFFHHPLAPMEKWRVGIAGESGAQKAGVWEAGNQSCVILWAYMELNCSVGYNRLLLRLDHSAQRK
jgi:hypothetical protein